MSRRRGLGVAHATVLLHPHAVVSMSPGGPADETCAPGLSRSHAARRDSARICQLASNFVANPTRGGASPARGAAFYVNHPE